jgi:hypothetical protein
MCEVSEDRTVHRREPHGTPRTNGLGGAAAMRAKPEQQPIHNVLMALAIPQSRVARILGVSVATAKRLLGGTYPPTPNEAERLAAYLNLPEAALWRDARWPHPRRTR